MPYAGYGYINGDDTTYSAAITPGGANQNWNYASLLNQVEDSTLFLAATGTPYASQFPLANLAANDPNTGSWAYFIKDATGLYLNGATQQAFPFVLSPPTMFIPVPFTYNDTYTGFSRFQLDTTYTDTASGTTFNVRLIQYNLTTIYGDGYGSLSIPNATIPNTLRIKTTTVQTDQF